MKNLVLLGLAFLITITAKAQVNAVTETGEEVLLYDNGTWSYKNESTVERDPIPVNEAQFKKGKKSSFLVKSNKINVGIHIDPKGWSFKKGTENDAAEYQFQKKGDDVYAMMIAEKLAIPVESLQQIAIDNARAAAPDLQVIKEEYRYVNGIQILMMQMTGTIQGLKFTYCGYYYSNEGGAVQLLTYTGTSLFDSRQKEIESFLNGFVVL